MASATHRHYPETLTLTKKQLGKRLDYWQRQLCLDQWCIDLIIQRDMLMDGALGSCKYSLAKHRATIHMMHPCDRLDHDDPYDMEQVMVHELLHLHFASWRNWSLEQSKMTDFIDAVCMEQPVERLACILVEMDRRREGSKR